MNINIHIGINQGTININSAEFSGSADSAEKREEGSVVWEQEEEKKNNITPAYTPACKDVGKPDVAVTTSENSVVMNNNKKINIETSPKAGVAAEEEIYPCVKNFNKNRENVSRNGKNVCINAENVNKNEKDVVVDAEVIVVHQNGIEEIAKQILEEIGQVYTPKKKDSAFLSNIYIQLSKQDKWKSNNYINKSERMSDCGSLLVYEINDKGGRKLIKASTCHVRLCPLCMWRRSLKAYKEMCMSYDYLLQEQEGSKFISLTLTQRNVFAEDLGQELDKVLYCFMRFMQLKNIKKFCLGYVRSLEVTYNREEDTYHPHIHVLIHTTEELYKGRNYLSKDKYIKIWKDLLNLNYEPSVKVERFKSKEGKSIKKALAEFCKYATKPSNYIYPKDEELTKRVTKVLDRDLAGRRLLSYGGSFRKARKKLLFNGFDDEIDESDDIIIGDMETEAKEVYFELYRWYFGEEKYKRLLGQEKENVLKYMGKSIGEKKL